VVHRLLPPIIAVAVLSLLVSHHPARAGKAWCLSDPVIELDGQVIDVLAYAYVNDNQIDDSEYIFTVAPGSILRVLDPGPDQTIAVYAVPGEANAVMYRVIDSPMVNLKLTVTAHTAGPATSAEVQSFGRAIAVTWPSTGGTVPSSPTTVETSSLTPVPTATTAASETATVAPTEMSIETATQAATETATAIATPTEMESATAFPTDPESSTSVPTETETATVAPIETETAAAAPTETATSEPISTPTTGPTLESTVTASATTEPVGTDFPAS
jgi:hypothetical protein